MIFKTLFSTRLLKKTISVNDEYRSKMRVLPNDLDLNFHMNNGRYLTLLDIARIEFLIRSGMDKVFYKQKLGGVTGGVHITFFKELNLFDQYYIKTKPIFWDEMWFYIEHEFIKDQMVMAHAVVKVTFTKKGKRVEPQSVLDQLDQKISKPEAPKYLIELIEGERDMVENVKKHNRELRNSKA